MSAGVYTDYFPGYVASKGGRISERERREGEREREEREREREEREREGREREEREREEREREEWEREEREREEREREEREREREEREREERDREILTDMSRSVSAYVWWNCGAETQCAYHITLRRVRVATVTVEKQQVLHILSVRL
jgi:hypothetical protein